MKGCLEYKGYLGSTEVDLEGGAIVGKLLYIQDVITYSSESVHGIEAAFREAVDDYLQTCEELGDEPDKPCKGTFNVRVGPDIHRDAVLAARVRGITLNEYVVSALVDAKAAQQRVVDHRHTHHVNVTVQQQATRVFTTGAGQHWETLDVAVNSQH